MGLSGTPFGCVGAGWFCHTLGAGPWVCPRLSSLQLLFHLLHLNVGVPSQPAAGAPDLGRHLFSLPALHVSHLCYCHLAPVPILVTCHNVQTGLLAVPCLLESPFSTRSWKEFLKT